MILSLLRLKYQLLVGLWINLMGKTCQLCLSGFYYRAISTINRIGDITLFSRVVSGSCHASMCTDSRIQNDLRLLFTDTALMTLPNCYVHPYPSLRIAFVFADT